MDVQLNLGGPGDGSLPMMLRNRHQQQEEQEAGEKEEGRQATRRSRPSRAMSDGIDLPNVTPRRMSDISTHLTNLILGLNSSASADISSTPRKFEEHG